MNPTPRRTAGTATAILLLTAAVGAQGQPDALDLHRAYQQLFRRAVARVAPSLVRIETVGGTLPVTRTPAVAPKPSSDGPDAPRRPFRDDPGSRFRVADGPTTGLIESADGYILTSSFNFIGDPMVITVILADGRRFVAELVARDRVRKLALLKIDVQDLPVPRWAGADDVQVGQRAVALGRALQDRQPTLSVGIVSALHRMMGYAIQTDANLSPANYGGPLIDLQGRVLGICVPMAQRPGELAGVEFYDAGIGFAVPKHRVEAIAAQLKLGQSFYRGWLGMVLDPTVPDRVQIKALADPSPLRSAGAQIGDAIVAVNHNPVRHFGNLVQALYMLPAGTRVSLTLERDAEEIPIDLTLARADDLGPLPPAQLPFDPSEPLPESHPQVP